MKFVLVVCAFVLVTLVVANDELPLAKPCDQTACQLPNCRCSNFDIPGDLAPRDTPQFVLLTFDDGVNIQNIVTYRSLVYNRANKNGCPAGVTFFVSHEYTDYTLVNELYNQGFEIALHSITHANNLEYWQNASPEILAKEFADQRTLTSHFANIPANTINGIRSPHLQSAGNATFQMLASAGLTYDLSWPTTSFLDPGLWPYTLDYASIQDCIIPPCPTASIPGPWVLPMIAWTDLEGVFCLMVDACFYRPQAEDEEGWFQFISNNFERHYFGNRAPFGIYVHEWFVRINPGFLRALTRFLNTVNNLNDAFMVNANEVIEWVKNPKPVSEYINQNCRLTFPSACSPVGCGPIESADTGKTYWMQICNRCPRTYPWLGNPRGE